MSTPSPSPALAGPADIQAYLRRRSRWARWFFAALAATALVVALVVGRGEPAALLAAGAFIVVMFLFTLASKRRLAETWRGEIVRLEIRAARPDKDDDSAAGPTEHQHLLQVRTGTGAQREVTVGPELHARYYAVGQIVTKLPGLPIPVQAQPPPGAARACANCGALLAADATGCPRCRCPVPDPARF